MATKPRVVDVVCLIFALSRVIYCQSPSPTDPGLWFVDVLRLLLVRIAHIVCYVYATITLSDCPSVRLSACIHYVQKLLHDEIHE